MAKSICYLLEKLHQFVCKWKVFIDMSRKNGDQIQNLYLKINVKTRAKVRLNYQR